MKKPADRGYKMENAFSKIIVNQGYNDINPVQCGWSTPMPYHSYGPAARTHWLLHFVVSGRGRFVSPRGEFAVARGDMFIIRPYEVTYYEADGQDPWEYIWIGFTAGVHLPARLGADVICLPMLADIFRRAYRAQDISEGGDGYEAKLCGCIWELLGSLSDRDASRAEATERYIRPALSMIENEFSNGITVEELAARLHLNRSYFSTLFRRTVGKSPSKYLTDLRMERAAMLLTRYGYSVSVAATSVGYPDVFSFSRAFKRHFGLSPLHYAERTLIGS